MFHPCNRISRTEPFFSRSTEERKLKEKKKQKKKESKREQKRSEK
jgi:hypothetical protein